MTSTCQLAPKPVDRTRYPLPPTVETLTAFIADRFHGRLYHGAHEPGNCACVMEAVSAYMEIGWNDNPANVRMFNLRPINDIEDVQAELRAKWMVRLSVAYWGSLDWPENKQQTVVEEIVRGTVNRITTKLPECEVAWSAVAVDAALAAAARTSRAANLAARAMMSNASSWAAFAVAAAEAEATSEEIFVAACEVWLDAAKQAG